MISVNFDFCDLSGTWGMGYLIVIRTEFLEKKLVFGDILGFILLSFCCFVDNFTFNFAEDWAVTHKA